MGQAMYAKGFEEALEHLRQSEPPGSNDLAAANTLATLSTASVGPAGRTLEVHRTLPESHRSLDVHKSLPEVQQNQGIPLSASLFPFSTCFRGVGVVRLRDLPSAGWSQ